MWRFISISFVIVVSALASGQSDTGSTNPSPAGQADAPSPAVEQLPPFLPNDPEFVEMYIDILEDPSMTHDQSPLILAKLKLVGYDKTSLMVFNPPHSEAEDNWLNAALAANIAIPSYADAIRDSEAAKKGRAPADVIGDKEHLVQAAQAQGFYKWEADQPTFKTFADLQAIIQDPNAPPAVIASKLAAYRAAMAKAQSDLEIAQQDLVSVLSQREEAICVKYGYLDY